MNLWRPSIAVASVVLFLAGCGGGGGRSSGGLDNTPAHDNLFVSWTQPPRYEDNTFLDIRRDIRIYEIVMYDNASQLAAWEGRAFPDNEVRSEYPLLIAYVAGVDSSSGIPVPVQDVAVDLTLQAGIVLPDNVFITVRSQSQDNGISAFAVGMFPQEGQ